MSSLRDEHRKKVINEASELYLNGATIDELCIKYNRKPSTIYRWLQIASVNLSNNAQDHILIPTQTQDSILSQLQMCTVEPGVGDSAGLRVMTNSEPQNKSPTQQDPLKPYRKKAVDTISPLLNLDIIDNFLKSRIQPSQQDLINLVKIHRQKTYSWLPTVWKYSSNPHIHMDPIYDQVIKNLQDNPNSDYLNPKYTWLILSYKVGDAIFFAELGGEFVPGGVLLADQEI